MQIDWKKPMQQTFEFYTVDPSTWKDMKKIDNVLGCTIRRDSSKSTLGSTTIDHSDIIDECYVRVWLIAIQNGYKHKIPLATVLVESPSSSFDGKEKRATINCYTPLIELNDVPPPIGYSLLKDENIMERTFQLCREYCRAPVIMADSSETLKNHFVSELSDTWLTFLSDLIANAKYRFALDEMGRILFEPEQDIASLRPVWTYNDDNSSILRPSINLERDLYEIPNVVEVIYSTDSGYLQSRIVNDDPNSPISTVNRGREKVYRVNNPNVIGNPTQDYLDAYATQLLRNLSCLENTITYTHGYCPVRIGDCVMFNYTRAGLVNIKAKVTSQTITCTTGCTVEETAVYTTRLWR